jgi:hypothetical protein
MRGFRDELDFHQRHDQLIHRLASPAVGGKFATPGRTRVVIIKIVPGGKHG